ncbi:ethylene-responsive transcription factor [Sarracenia purpurea var. burkii]
MSKKPFAAGREIDTDHIEEINRSVSTTNDPNLGSKSAIRKLTNPDQRAQPTIPAKVPEAKPTWNLMAKPVGSGILSSDRSASAMSVCQRPLSIDAKAVCDKTAYKLHDDFTRLNFPNLWHNGSHIGDDFSEYKPLRSAIDAKLQVICQSLAQGNSIKVKNKKMSKKPFAAGRGGGR